MSDMDGAIWEDSPGLLVRGRLEFLFPLAGHHSKLVIIKGYIALLISIF